MWLSLRNASFLCEAIASSLSSLDPEHEEDYKANTLRYQEQLAKLDEAYTQAVSEGRVSTLLFGDRFPFRYLTEDYGLHYYAAFAGCSAETEASFETIIFLARKMDELQLSSVCTIEGSDNRIAETIIASTEEKNQKITVFDSLQAITAEDVKNSITKAASFLPSEGKRQLAFYGGSFTAIPAEQQESLLGAAK